MRGSVYRRGKANYWIAVELGADESGKRTRHQQRAGATRKEAQRVLNEVLHRLGSGEYVAPVKLTLGGFLRDQWLPAIRSTIRRSTFDSYQMNIETHIVPALGSVKLQALTPARLNAFYSDLIDHGRVNGKGGLSPKTVRNIHIPLRKALADAVKWNILARNVAQFADPPRLRQAGDKEMKTWTAQELRTFLDQVADDRLYPGFHLVGSTGMRRGEILGVRWTDIDLDAAQLSVRQTLITTDYELVFSTPKTARGRRVIALDKQTVTVLRTWKKTQLEERMAIGAAYEDNGLVFCKVDGQPLHPDLFSQTFDRYVTRSGLPKIRFQDVRHTHASLALQAGVPVKVISERLGHASVAFTMDVYAHVLPGMQEDAAEKVAGLIFAE